MGGLLNASFYSVNTWWFSFTVIIHCFVSVRFTNGSVLSIILFVI